MLRKICVVTGTRAEFGLLYWLMKEVENTDGLELQLIVTGMHLSPEFGLTFSEVESEFSITKKIEILLSSDSPIGISKSMGLAQISFSEAYQELKPDIILLLGDRFEIFSAASAAMIARIPIAHIHGGESTEGVIDEAIRHSITKMSHLHFAATEKYRNRIIQLGENPENVFNVGSLSVESIHRLSLLEKDKFEESIDFKLNKKNLLITYHPVTLEGSSSSSQFEELLCALDNLEETLLIFTKSNSDTYGRIINEMIDKFVAAKKSKAISFYSLGQVRYLSALQYVDGVIGNSSSGLYEAPSFRIGTINIGDRQKGRIKPKSVIDCAPNEREILSAMDKLYSPQFQEMLKGVINPFEGANTCSKIAEVLQKTDLSKLLKKTFFDQLTA